MKIKFFQHSVRFYILLCIFTFAIINYTNDAFGLVDKAIDKITNSKVETEYRFIYIDEDYFIRETQLKQF